MSQTVLIPFPKLFPFSKRRYRKPSYVLTKHNIAFEIRVKTLKSRYIPDKTRPQETPTESVRHALERQRGFTNGGQVIANSSLI